MTFRSAPPAIFLVLVLAVATLVGAAPSGRALDAPSAASRTTVEPQPPMALSVDVAGLEKHVRGGVVSVRLKVVADLPVENAVLTAEAPGDLRFADGSRVKTWNLDLAQAGTREIPVDILVPRDGRYALAATIEGTTQGRAIRRGAAGTLEVGRRAGPRPSREGAIEYPALEAGNEAGEVQP